MSETLVVNLRHEEYDVYIGRAGGGHRGTFGNPYVVGRRCGRCGETHDTGRATLPCYEAYLAERAREDDAFAEALRGLRGKRLGCFCKPTPCHGDVIVAWLEADRATVVPTASGLRLLVTGGRAYGERWADPKAPPGRRVERPGWRDEVAHLRWVLTEVAGGGPVTLVQGGAQGADRRAREWAEHWGHEVVTFEADWARHGRSAGPKRNEAMVAAGADLVVAFAGGLGTANCVGLAVNAGIKLRDERGWRAEGVGRG